MSSSSEDQKRSIRSARERGIGGFSGFDVDVSELSEYTSENCMRLWTLPPISSDGLRLPIFNGCGIEPFAIGLDHRLPTGLCIGVKVGLGEFILSAGAGVLFLVGLCKVVVRT